jgi:hypothetical protein
MAPRTRKTVDAAATNPALVANSETLIVGDSHQQRANPAREKKTRVPFGSYMDPELQRRFKAECALMGIEMQAALEEAVHDWLKKYHRPAG